MARTVSVHNIVVEIITEVTKPRLELQDEIMDALTAAGHEVASVEATVLREKRMPDRQAAPAAAPPP